MKQTHKQHHQQKHVHVHFAVHRTSRIEITSFRHTQYTLSTSWRQKHCSNSSLDPRLSRPAEVHPSDSTSALINDITTRCLTLMTSSRRRRRQTKYGGGNVTITHSSSSTGGVVHLVCTHERQVAAGTGCATCAHVSEACF